jgi:uncharacterized membrane protein YhaH (DUF805 family)
METNVFYIVMTNNPDLAKEVKSLIDQRKSAWWKIITKYYKNGNKEPYHETSETSTGKKA